MGRATNWNQIRTSAEWQAKAMQLIDASIEAARSNDRAAMRSASSALTSFLEHRTLACPDEVADAVYGAQSELSLLVAADVAGSIASRTAQLNAYRQDIERAGASIHRAARMISLDPIKNAVDSVDAIVTDIESLRDAIDNEESSAQLKTKIAAVVRSLRAAVNNIKSEFPAEG